MWFEASKTGNLVYVRSRKGQMARRQDARRDNGQLGVFQGFCAIHYAIINEQYEIVKELIEAEYFCRIPRDSVIFAQSIGPKA